MMNKQLFSVRYPRVTCDGIEPDELTILRIRHAARRPRAPDDI
jgi:hypothetical protein